MQFTYTNTLFDERRRIARAVTNNTCKFTSYYSRNSSLNVDYSLVLGIPSSIIYGKPIVNTSYALRTQRIRALLR
jgi:hypothetical protein